MQRAGAAAAAEIALRYRDRLHGGVIVFAGPGNNGGDGWVVARALAAGGVPVRVIEPAGAKTPDAVAERALALPHVAVTEWSGSGDVACGESIVIDALLGTGSAGTLRGPIAHAAHAVADARQRGAAVVALDLPTGAEVVAGETPGPIVADLTLTFGTVKRTHLVQRDACGDVVVLDIGLGEFANLDDGAPRLVDERWVAERIPPISASAHKGTRKKLAICGGARGMAGAAILAARAALRSSVGMVRLVVDDASLDAVQKAEPLALAGRWPADDDSVDREIGRWADALVIGPGLGKSLGTRELVERILSRFQGPVVLDADALNVFEGDLAGLARALGAPPRAALLTPHPAEFARLIAATPGVTVETVLADRFEIGSMVTQVTGAAVLLKGVPTVIFASGGPPLVSASGNPVLAAAGSGDVLSGIAGTLLAQIGNPLEAGAAAAWIHGRAAERAVVARQPFDSRGHQPDIRGATLTDVLDALSLGWTLDTTPPRYPILLELPRVGEGA